MTTRTERPCPVVLVVVDGFGYGPDPAVDAIAAADMPRWRALLAAWPNSRLDASAQAVGPDVPRIYFSKGGAGHLDALSQIDSEVISVDWRLDLDRARAALPAGKVLQGNLDPISLLAGPEVTRTRAEEVLKKGAGGPHVMNLGHGILPMTPLDSVEALCDTVRNWKG